MNAEYHRLKDQARQCWEELESVAETGTVKSPIDAAGCEEQLVEMGIRLASLAFGMVLVRSVADRQSKDRDQKFIKALPKKFHSQGKRSVSVSLRADVKVSLSVRYFHRLKDPSRSRRKNKRRGLYPTLLRLGIHGGWTPATTARMVKSAALLGSYQEAAVMLEAEGLNVSVNRLREVVAGTGNLLRKLERSGSLCPAGSVAGKRVVVTTDGGRVRIREKRRGKTKKGRKRFEAAWREPRLIMIYVVDEEGRQSADFRPIIDGSMGSCDELFALLLAYLEGLEITQAERVQFVADGAAWIWKRVPKLIAALGLKDEQVQQLIDYWHAVEYLGKLAESSSLDKPRRKQWVTTQKKRLLRGEIGSVVSAIDQLVGRKPTKDQTTWLNYFITHGIEQRRMDYSTAKTHSMPIGSGAIESAIRRIINLRVKGNAIYWLRGNAETMIRLRAWIKAGRGEELFAQTTCVTPQLAL